LTGVAGVIAVVAASLRHVGNWLGDWVTRAEQVKQRVDSRVAKRRAEGQAQIKRLEQTLGQRHTDYQLAKQKTDEAQQRVAQKEVELQRATPGDLLARFIQDRIKSDDYRQYLGVLAVVRRDFEQLSGLMELENWKLAKPQTGEAETRGTERKYASIDDERTGEAERVNRIVLYIDDLDRCPPRKVVEVLQAVHLLLAFPLFVVVVGVDARWVHRSLGTTYGRLLTGGSAAATPEDYLEKVFQIPFWLEDTAASARARMLHGLLDASV
jgi:hypothetical protein